MLDSRTPHTVTASDCTVVLLSGHGYITHAACAGMLRMQTCCYNPAVLQTAQERTQAEQALRPFGQSTEYVPHCKVCYIHPVATAGAAAAAAAAVAG